MADDKDTGVDTSETGPISVLAAAEMLADQEPVDGDIEEDTQNAADNSGNTDDDDEPPADGDADGEDQNDDEPTKDEIQDDEAEDQQILDAAYDDVLIDIGGDKQVTLAELKKGNLFQADYSTKTMNLANDRRQLDTERQQFQAAMRESQHQQGELLRLIGKPTEPDWIKIQNENPESLTIAKLNYDKQVENYDKSIQQIDAAQSEGMDQMRNETAQMFLRKFPEFAENTASFQETQPARETIAQEFGFSQAEIDNIVDLRVVGVIEQVRALRGALARLKAAPVKKGKARVVRVQKGGKAKTGSERDLAALDSVRKRVRDPNRPMTPNQAAAAMFALENQG